MNKRQALKAAAQHIEELEDFNRRATADIKAYNQCIDGMIAGKSPCEWCEENRTGECENENKGGKGCVDWWLRFELGNEKGDADDSEAVSGTGDNSGTGTEIVKGAAGTL